jgi:pyocin large subunit-like protein
MSIDATRWAWEQVCDKATDKFVLLSMADRADEHHCCYPSIQRLADDTQLNRKTVMECIRRLESRGLIEWTDALCRLIGVEGRDK